MALFKHAEVAGYRSTGSRQHDKLPKPHKEMKSITEEPGIRVGFKYMYGISQPYSVAKGGLVINDITLPTNVASKLGKSRTAQLLLHLTQQVGEAYRIEVPYLDSSQYSTFKGGGDIRMLKGGKPVPSGALIHGEQSWSTDEECIDHPAAASSTCVYMPQSPGSHHTPQAVLLSPPCDPYPPTDKITPPKPGEFRCGMPENKMRSMQTDFEVCLQLQANMMLTVSEILHSADHVIC